LINNNLVEKKWQCNNIVVGSITLVYDHHKNDILNKFAAIQDDAADRGDGELAHVRPPA